MNGYILVGGRSRRMGSNKAQLSINGHSLCHIITDKLKKAGCDEVFLVGKNSLPFSIPQLTESWSDHHPLYGVHTALDHSSNDFCIITPCDIPFVSITTYQRLIAQSVTTILSTSAKKQPLLGIFSTSKRERALFYAQQHRSVMSFVENEAYIVVPDDELHNINHPDDLRGFYDHR